MTPSELPAPMVFRRKHLDLVWGHVFQLEKKDKTEVKGLNWLLE